MDQNNVSAVTSALDVTIAKVAREQLEWLSSGLSSGEVAAELHRSLRSFSHLRRGGMPRYDDWDALFYLSWYQPSQINLAYTLARNTRQDKNPLRSGDGTLQVVDFGCGSLAMQFGIALAAADAVVEYGRIPGVAIVSEDNSAPMRDMGLKLWVNFINEISDTQKYPDLEPLRQVCREMRFDDRSAASINWLTALHVAYADTVDQVKVALDTRVESIGPDVILISLHHGVPKSLAYSPQGSEKYSPTEDILLGTQFNLSGTLDITSMFRRKLYNEKIAGKLPAEADNFMSNYLTVRNTEWTTSGSGARLMRYYGTDDLPW